MTIVPKNEVSLEFRNKAGRLLFSTFWDNFNEKQPDLYLFGMGKCTAHEVIPVLNILKIPIKGIIDNNKHPLDRDYKGTPIISTDELKALPSSSTFIITVQSAVEKISTQLRESGYNDIFHFKLEVTDILCDFMPKKLSHPILMFTSHSCQTYCPECSQKNFRKRDPHYQISVDDIDYLSRMMQKHNVSAPIIFSGGDSLLWPYLSQAVSILEPNPNVPSLELYTAGVDNQLEILYPLINRVITKIRISKYNSNHHLVDELVENFGNKIFVCDVPQHTIIEEVDFGIDYPVECGCELYAYHEQHLCMCPWIVILGDDEAMEKYSIPIEQAFDKGIPAHWKYGVDPAICSRCASNISWTNHLKVCKTP